MLTKIISQDNIDRISKYIDKADKIVITAHVGPDGDALGSSLGLYHFLTDLEKSVQVIVPNSFPDFLGWLPGAKEILIYESYPEFAKQLLDEADLIFCLDFNTINRLGRMGDAVLAAKPYKKILIDHHLQPDNFCDVIVSHPSISSTSELVFRLICRLESFSQMSKQTAECIYTGMMTDTGSFTYNSNDPEIYFIISELLSKGIDKDEIYRKVNNTYSESRLQLMGYLLHKKMTVSGHAALISLTQEEKKKFNFTKGDAEGFVNLPLSIKGMVLSIFLNEEANHIKVSLRSTGTFPCNLVAAKYFAGGGHLNASGGEFKGTMEEACALFELISFEYAPLVNREP